MTNEQFVPVGILPAMKDAACKGVSTSIFYVEDEVPSPIAVRLCSGCPVRERCLQWALDHKEDGYWGGTTSAQRRAIMSGRERVKCPMCRGRDIVELGRESVCLGCGLSW